MSPRLFQIFACLAIALAPVIAAAQEVEESAGVPSRMPNGASFDPDKATAPIRLIEGPGWKAGEDTVFHPIVGIETGVISNVFYTNDSNCPVTANCVHTAGLLRLLAQIGVGSLSSWRLAPTNERPEDPITEQPLRSVKNPGSFQYRADLRAAYDQMLSPDGTVSATGGLSLGANLQTLVNPLGPVTLIGFDEFNRTLRAANFETNVDTTRDINSLDLRLLYHPHDRTYSGYLFYDNAIDVFEADKQQFADRMLNTVGIHPMYQWLPQTQLYAQVTQGFDSGIGSSSTKVSSYPTSVSAGIATLLTPMITFHAAGGYTWLNYSSGATTSGIFGGAILGFRYSEMGRVVFQYWRLFEDSINANYYSEHVLRAWAYQRLGHIVVSVQPEVHFRDYEGTIVTSTSGMTTRSDQIFSVIAGVSYILKSEMAIALDYRFTDDSTDFRYMTDGITIDPSYSRHAVLLGFRLAL